MAAKKLLPHVEKIMYTDTDTLLDWMAIRQMKSDRLMMISSKVNENNQIVLRTNWFILRTRHKLFDCLMNTWYYTGRNVEWQDETVLNELYAANSWVRDSITVVKSGSRKWGELRLCESWLEKKRASCMIQMNRRASQW